MNASRITHHASRITLPLLLAALIGAGLFVFAPAPASADEPCDIAIDLTGWTVYDDFHGNSSVSYVGDHLESFQTGNGTSGGSIRSAGMNYTIKDGDVLNQDLQIVGGEIVQIMTLHTSSGGSLTVFAYGNDVTARTTRNFDLSSFAGQTISWIELTNYDSQNGDRYLNIYALSITSQNCEPEPPADLCPLVQNGHFAAADGWLLDGTAVISDNTLSLAAGDIAAQNLTLESNLTYNAVISITEAAATSLSVVLGTQSEVLDIAEPGLYTATLTTPQLGGPIIYGLQNDGPGSVSLDYACLSLATGDDSTTGECFAPINGAFDTSTGWDWYRDARWNEAAENGFLPFVPGDEFAKSLLMSTSLYTMPVITGEQHILLSFEAETANDQSAVIATTVDNGPTSSAGYFEVYPDIYTFELDVSALAGESAPAALAFANAGVDPITSFAAEDDIYLDNVCIFLADRGPRLPGPNNNPDPGAIGPIDFNYGYGCADAAGILAGWGINMNLYHAIYGGTGTAGDSWFAAWWNWLMAGFWVMLESLLCFLLTALGWIVNVIEYGINNFLNLGSWIQRQGFYFFTFFIALWAWFSKTVGNIMAWWWSSLGNILAWLWQSGLNSLAFVGSLYNFLVGLVNGVLAWILPFLQAVLHFISPLRLFVDLAMAFWDLFWMLLTWIWANVFMAVNLPIRFYYAFNDGVQTEAFSSLMSCAGANFWCGLLAGTQLVNQTVGHTVLYPIVIVGIILMTLAIFWRHIWALFSINIR